MIFARALNNFIYHITILAYLKCKLFGTIYNCRSPMQQANRLEQLHQDIASLLRKAIIDKLSVQQYTNREKVKISLKILQQFLEMSWKIKNQIQGQIMQDRSRRLVHSTNPAQMTIIGNNLLPQSELIQAQNQDESFKVISPEETPMKNFYGSFYNTNSIKPKKQPKCYPSYKKPKEARWGKEKE